MRRHISILFLCLFSLLFTVSAQAQSAQEILRATGVSGGLVVHLGCGDGKLTVALRANERYLVHGLDTYPLHIQAARKRIAELAIEGKVSVELWSENYLPYTDNLVNLLVAEDPGAIPMDEITRVLAPRGVAYLKENNKWKKIVKPWPDDIDEWTHFLHDPGNNAVAQDTVVGPPRHFQWIADPKWARSHDHLSSLSSMVSSRGRVFYIIDEGPISSVAIAPKWFLVARDAFSGVLLWKRAIGPWEGHLRDFRTGPTEIQRRLVAVGERVFVTLGYGKPVSALDAATGETIRTFEETDNALEIIAHNNILYTVVGDRPPEGNSAPGRSEKNEKIWHWWPIYEEIQPLKSLIAHDIESGKVLWTLNDADTASLMPTTLAAAENRVFYQSPKEIIAIDARTGEPLWRADRPVNLHRPTWSAPTLVVHDGVLLSADRSTTATLPDIYKPEKTSQWVVNSNGGIAPVGKMIAFSAATGKRLWESDARECYNAPVDVLVADGLVWSGNLISRKDPGITQGLDLLTGKVKRTRTKAQDHFSNGMVHHRCYRNKATSNYLVLGRDGIEYIDVATGEGLGHSWVRGSCQYGVLPCNGLTYAPPHSCACHIESKLNSFNALAPASKTKRVKPAEATRLQKGPAYGKSAKQASNPKDWPTYRHDPARSSQGTTTVNTPLKALWTASLPGGKISAPVIAGGKVYVAAIDAHTIHALDAQSGKALWSYTAAGRIDSPPTIHQGAVLFGSADGWIYNLRASDGALAWRFRAALEERRIVARGQLESSSPVSGSVMVQDGVLYAVAGRTTFLDEGIRLLRLKIQTGEKLSETNVASAALPDILSSDGERIFLRHVNFDKNGVEQKTRIPHLYSPGGFLDDSWWHRNYWQVGSYMPTGVGWGSWPNVGTQAPSGRLLTIGGECVYGYGRMNDYHRNGSHMGLGANQYLLYAASLKPEKASPRKVKTKQAPAPAPKPSNEGLWSKQIPVLGRAMAVCGTTLFVAGPPDLFVASADKDIDPYHIESLEALADQAAALAGKRGGALLAFSTTNGDQLDSVQLDAPPEWDAMAAANGCLYLTTIDGEIICFD